MQGVGGLIFMLGYTHHNHEERVREVGLLWDVLVHAVQNRDPGKAALRER